MLYIQYIYIDLHYDILFDIISSIYFDILSDILSGILSVRASPQRPELAIGGSAKSWHRRSRQERRRGEEGGGVTLFLKSRDPHLAGGGKDPTVTPLPFCKDQGNQHGD